MAEFPSMPLYTDAYLADTRHLSTEEHGAYLLLIICAWRSPGCALPNDDTRLARMVGLSRAKWLKIKDTILDFFVIEGDKILHGKLQEIYENLQKKRAVNSQNGSEGGKAKSLKNKKRAVANATNSPERTASENVAYQNQNQNISSNEDIKNKQNRFEEFWDAFADKRGRPGAEKSWNKINPDDALADKIIQGAKAYADWRTNVKPKDLTPKMAQGWLTDQRWEDELPKPKPRLVEAYNPDDWKNQTVEHF